MPTEPLPEHFHYPFGWHKECPVCRMEAEFEESWYQVEEVKHEQ